MAKSQRCFSKNLSISTYISHLTLPIRLDSSQASSTVPYSEFLLYVPIQMTKSKEQKFFLNGYKHEATKVTKLNPSSSKPSPRAKNYYGPSDTKNNDHTAVIFHLPFHPNDPPSHKNQQAWRNSVVSPRYHIPLPDMRHPKSKEKCNIQRMIIAYRRPMNIGNLLSHRNLNTNPSAPPVSSYYPFD